MESIFTKITRDKSTRVVADDSTRVVADDSTRVIADKPRQSEQQTELQPGMVIKERFQLQHQLGEGGMGVVFAARDLIQEEVSNEESLIAIKFLSEGIKGHPDAFRLLQQECKKSQGLAHPNIVTVFDFDRDGDIVYLTMQLLTGRSLEEHLSDHEFETTPLQAVEPILTDIVAGLSYAHQQGIVHSDIKPENIFLTDQGARILDFGIARAIKQSDTTNGNVLGLSPAYASLEMFHDAVPDAKDDIYALACITYQLLAGRHPFNRKSAKDAYNDKLTAKQIDGLGAKQWKALLLGLSFERDDRQSSVDAFLQQLLPQRRQPWKYAAYAASAIAVVFGLFYLLAPVELVEPNLFENPGPEIPLNLIEQQQISDYLEVAEVHMMVGRLISPPGSNALNEYQKILQLQPYDRQTIEGLKLLLSKISDRALKAIETGELSKAEMLVTIGLDIYGNHAGLLAIKKQLPE
jgi:serine/threonine protein kinase